MPAIEVRPIIPADLEALTALDHSYVTDYAWQMDVKHEAGQVLIVFREVRLPRSLRQEYPRPALWLADEWNQRSGILVAVHEGSAVGYVSLSNDRLPRTAWVTDLAVVRRLRRQGIGTALLLAAQDWASHHHALQMVVEMQSKNFPAISLVEKMGFTFSGYQDGYFPTQDIALFFRRGIH